MLGGRRLAGWLQLRNQCNCSHVSLRPAVSATERFRSELQDKARARSPLPSIRKAPCAAGATANGPPPPLKIASAATAAAAATIPRPIKSSSSTVDTSWCTDAFLRDIPKADIHVHLDGSLRLETLVELINKTPNAPSLPTENLDDLRASIFKKSFASLEEYLRPFMYTVAVMQTAKNLERVAYEFAVDNFA